MKEYIERSKVLEAFGEEPYIWQDRDDEIQENADWHTYTGIVKAIPAADVVGLDVVAEMLYVSCGCDECPCNYGPTDEWLPEVCDLKDECPNPKDKLGCWKQYIKHFAERPEYLRGAYEREVDHD